MEEVIIIKLLLSFFYWCNILLAFSIATLGIVCVMYLEQWRRRRMAKEAARQLNARVQNYDEL